MPLRPSDEPVRVGVVGNLNIDLILREATGLPIWGQEIEAASHVAASSGQAGYLAMALGCLETDVDLVGRLGNDHNGHQILADLRRCHVSTDHVEISADMPTGITVAIVRDDGERAFVSDFGATREIDGALLARHLERLRGTQIVCLVALFNLRSLALEDATRFLGDLRRSGVTTVLDTGWDPDGWRPETVAATKELLAEVDLFLPNLDECQALLGAGVSGAYAAARLQEFGPRTVVVKCGAAGSHGRHDDTVANVAAFPVEVFDAVGAGDTFDAGFIHAWSDAHDLEAAMRHGTAAAAFYLQRPSERFPSIADVRALLASEPSNNWYQETK